MRGVLVENELKLTHRSLPLHHTLHIKWLLRATWVVSRAAWRMAGLCHGETHMPVRHALSTRHSIWHRTPVWRHLNTLPRLHPVHHPGDWWLGLVAILGAKSRLLCLVLWGELEGRRGR